jgi:hypothetical protein
LIVVDNAGNPSIHYFSTDTRTRLTAVGGVGEGPGDFVATPRYVSGAAPPGAEWFFDSRLRRVTGFESSRGSGGNQRKGCVPQVVEMRSGDPVGAPGYAARCRVVSVIV